MFRRKDVTNLFLAHQIGIEIILSHIPVPARGKDKKMDSGTSVARRSVTSL